MKNIQSKNKKNKLIAGVSIVELIVFLAVFFIILSATVSIFMAVIRQQRNTLRDKDVVNQVNYAIDYMSRITRMAIRDYTGSCLGTSFINYDYKLTRFHSASGFYRGIKLKSYDGFCHEFFLHFDGRIKERKNNVTRDILASGRLNKFVIKHLRFIIDGNKNKGGNPPTNLLQPRVTFSMSILTYPTDNNVPREKLFQTTVSRRDQMKTYP